MAPGNYSTECSEEGPGYFILTPTPNIYFEDQDDLYPKNMPKALMKKVCQVRCTCLTWLKHTPKLGN